jgi:8-oxo-dGTP pyrophosphatase MutT (NUDIX family)
METIRCKDNWGREVELPAERFRYRPSVYAVFWRQGQVLVCGTRSTGRLWLPGGGVEEGESHETALRREVREEAGITELEIAQSLGDFRNFCYYAPEDDACDAHLYFYLCTTLENGLLPNERIEDGEATDFRWMTLKEVLKEEFCDASERIHGILARLGELDWTGEDGMLG